VTRLHTGFVLGYHGCEEAVGRQAVDGTTEILQSTRDFDWLGSGAYFWEADPTRAYEWAQQKKARGDYKTPFVIGAVVDLGNCLDLTTRDGAELVRAAYASFKTIREKAGLTMPENRAAPKDASSDLVMRYLDCAVINHLHSILKQTASDPFDTVRALLPEGTKLYAGSGFMDRTHVQIAVRNLTCIKSVFHVKGPWFRPLAEI
jgi:hypothetical protein